MDTEKIKEVLEEEPEEAVSQLLEDIEDWYGEVPYILNFMKDKPELFIPKVMYDNSIMREFKRLDPKTIEMICIGVSSALRCEHCLKMHIKVARRLGIKKEEIFDAVLIGGTLSNAAVLAEGTRAIDHIFDNGENTCDETCEVCNISDPEKKE